MRPTALFLDTLFSLPRIVVPIGAWFKVSAERRRLAALSDRQLLDMGLTRHDVEREASRPFWDLPLRRRDLD